MICVIAPSVAAKANALGLESLFDINGDGTINTEDVNLCATKQGLTIPDSAIPTQPQVVKAVVAETEVENLPIT